MSSTSLYFLSRHLTKKNFQSYFDPLDTGFDALDHPRKKNLIWPDLDKIKIWLDLVS